MGKYLAKRFLSSIVALVLFLTLMFFLTEIIIPNDFTQQFALTMNRELREQLQQELGLDRPLWERYLNWANRMIHGHLGTSFYGFPVAAVLKQVIPATLLVFGTGTGIAFVIGQWLGKAVAWRGPGVLSNSATFSAVTLYTTFPPWLGFLITYLFARRLRLFRSAFGYDPTEAFQGDIWREASYPPYIIMTRMLLVLAGVVLILAAANWILRRTLSRGLPAYLVIPLFVSGTVGGWYAFGFGPQAMNVLSIAGLPMLTYILLSFGETMLIMRTSMTDTLKEEYVRIAQAKGLPGHMVRDKHAARNAVLPVLSRLVISLPFLLTGLIMIEDSFNWPGLSQSLFTSLYQQDMPMVMGALLLVGVLSMIARMILDVLHVYLNPQVRYEAGSLRRMG